MANLFDFHLFPEPVEHSAVLLTGLKCVPGRAATCSLWSGEKLQTEGREGGRAAASLPVPYLWHPVKERGGGPLSCPWGQGTLWCGCPAAGSSQGCTGGIGTESCWELKCG